MGNQDEISQKDKDYLKQQSENEKVPKKERQSAKALLQEIERMEREWAQHQEDLKEYSEKLNKNYKTDPVYLALKEVAKNPPKTE